MLILVKTHVQNVLVKMKHARDVGIAEGNKGMGSFPGSLSDCRFLMNNL